ncbi:ABC transporter [Paenibacillus pectinilyticus]|uniref:ABC transporter n=1 Tax=Paenibacillus pectinilyticus TaxID=512399 RepID=A0A1C0ZW28_9BACL|nr:ATP-binding cassette domain-containing protein [Paenibacillus pectinilyticus]OCT12277.1 ABC transporter [Paenibacillus pectinilyticus]
MTALLEIQGLAKGFGGHGKSLSSYLFSEVSAKIMPSERIALIGASGQGKSTLLRTMAVLHTPDEGDMLFHQNSFRKMDPRLWRKQISYVAQQPVMLPGSIEDNLRTGSRLHGEPYDLQLAKRLLAAAALGEKAATHPANDLSGGEKQRVALIRSLLMRPAVLLLDEVTSSLDTISTMAIEELLLQWQEAEGTTMIWITHDLKQATRVSDRVWFMASGTLAEDRHTSEFFQQPVTDAARHFIQFREEGETS